MSYPQSINLLIILNGSGILGRVIPGFLADRYFGPLNVILFGILSTAIINFCWMAVHTSAGTYAWATVYGVSTAIIQGLFPATLSSLTQDLSKAGVRMGQTFVRIFSLVVEHNMTLRLVK